MNGTVKYKVNGREKELSFEHALSLFRQLSTIKGGVLPKIVSNHEFKDNELIIKPSKGDSAKSNKPSKSTKGRKVRKPAKDSDTSV
jgi:hypothetical protein